MKTLLTLDKADKPYGFPQLDGSGNLQVTGSLFGTSSWAENAMSSIHSDNSTSASYTLSSSYASNSDSATFSLSSSQAQNSVSSSYTLSSSYSNVSVSSSYSLSSSYVVSSSKAVSSSYANSSTSASYSLSGSYSLSSSYSVSSSYSNNSTSASYSVSSSRAVTSSFALSASFYGGSVVSASYSSTASYAPNYVGNSSTSSFVINSQTASFVTNSQTSSMSVATASYVQNAQSASYVSQAVSSSYTVSASYASTASYVTPLKQGVQILGTLRLDPTQDPGSANITSSYLFQSASNTALGYDLYFRQDGNIVKWKWIEGQLNTGLLYGGVLTYSGSIGTIYVSSGSGIIVTPNASTGSEVNPQLTYVNWPAQSVNISAYTSSYQATYLYIDSTGTLQTQFDSFFTPTQYGAAIPLGMANHSGRNIITSVANNVTTVYNTSNQIFDFIQAFGPLRITGLSVTGQSGTLRVNIGAGSSYILGGFYQQDPNSISHKDTSAYPTASIARVYRSGSSFITDNNGGTFYTTIDPTKYDNGTGTLTNVGNNNYSIQRVFFNPFTGKVHVYYGQNTYGNLATAIANLSSDSFSEAMYTSHQYVFVGYLIVKGNTSDLTNAQNTIVQAGLFRNTAGSSGGTTFTTRLSDLTDVTITTPTSGQSLIYNGSNWINSTPATSSYSVSSSYANTASFAPNYLLTSSTGSMLQPYVLSSNTSSFVVSSQTSSFVQNSVTSSMSVATASYVQNSVSSSFATNALTASYLSGYVSPFPYTGSAIISGSLIVTGSINVTQGITGSHFGTSSYATQALTSSYSNNSVSASYAITASYALNAGGSGTGGTSLGLVQAFTVGLQNIF